MKKTSEIKKKDTHISPFLYGVIYNRIISSKNNNFFLLTSSFKKSIKTKENINDYVENYIKLLNKKTLSQNNRWVGFDEFKKKFGDIEWNGSVSSSKAFFVIENDMKISKNDFLKIIYYLLINEKFINENIFSENKKDFLRGFWEIRGSLDISAKFLSQDFFYDNDWELRRINFLVNYLNIPSNILNINFRELQQQFLKNINKRNTQIRINLPWYLREIGLMNEYKKMIILESNFAKDFYVKENITFFDIKNDLIPNYVNSFLDKINFYIDEIISKKLDNYQIENIRNHLNLKKITNPSKIRNKIIVELCKIEKPDICSGCDGDYDISTRTFVHQKTNKPYLEIHHNIPFSNGKKYDVLENLVKLCPICHKQLSKGISFENDQKKIIKNILINNEDTLNFCKLIFFEKDINVITNKIYTMLK